MPDQVSPARKAAEEIVGPKGECPDRDCDSAGLACGSCWKDRVDRVAAIIARHMMGVNLDVLHHHRELKKAMVGALMEKFNNFTGMPNRKYINEAIGYWRALYDSVPE